MKISKGRLLHRELFFICVFVVSIISAMMASFIPYQFSYVAPGMILIVYIIIMLLRHPYWGLLGYAVLIPLESLAIQIEGLTIVKIWGMVAGLAVLAWLGVSGRRLYLPFLIIPFVALVGTFLASWLIGGQSEFGAQSLITLITVGVVSLILTNTMLSAKIFRLLLLAIGLSSTGYACLVLFYAFQTGLLGTSDPFLINRFRSEFLIGDLNYLSLYLTFGLLANISLLYLGLSLRLKRWYQLFSVITASGIVATLSRTGIILMLLGVLFLTSQLSKRGRALVQVLKWSIGFLVLILLLGGPAFRSRLLFSGDDISVMGRFWAWEAGLRMWLDYPILGIGLGRFAESYQLYRPLGAFYIEYMVAHNSWVEILAETGLIGFFIICFIAVIIAREWLSLSRFADNGEITVFRCFIGAVLLILLAGSFVLNLHFNKYLWLFAFLTFRMKLVFQNNNMSPLQKACFAAEA